MIIFGEESEVLEMLELYKEKKLELYKEKK